MGYWGIGDVEVVGGVVSVLEANSGGLLSELKVEDDICLNAQEWDWDSS